MDYRDRVTPAEVIEFHKRKLDRGRWFNWYSLIWFAIGALTVMAFWALGVLVAIEWRYR